MKSERRHELQHNELADWLVKTGEQIKPHQNLILAVVAVAAVVIVGYTWWARHTATRTSLAWTDLERAIQSDSPDLIGAVADEYPNTIVGQTASVLLGDFRLAAACNQRFASAMIAERELRAAEGAYSSVMENNLSEELCERATYGMARVRETEGKLDAARQFYSDIVRQWPDGAFATEAKRRLADFEERDTKLMFADLHKYEPKGEFAEEPGGLGPPPTNSPPAFETPKEPPVDSGPIDLGPPDLGKGLHEEPPGPATDALGNALIGEPGKSSPGTAEKPKADVNEKGADVGKTVGKKSAEKKTDTPAKKP